MKALVTGCAGFIGSQLCEALLDRKDGVIGIDAFTTSYDTTIKYRNIAAAKKHSNFTLVEADLNTLDLISVLENVDCVFHTAGQPGVRSSWGQEFDLYLNNNIRATQRLLETLKQLKIDHPNKETRLIYSSSSSVYGNTDQLPISESVLCKPYSPYGTTKLAAEHLCSLYHTNYGLSTVSLRYFTVFGPRQRPDMGFHIFIKALLQNKSISILGDGQQTRDFTYVDDIVQANLLAAEKPVVGEVINIGGGNRRPLMDVFATLQEVTGIKPNLEHKPVEKGDVRDTWADTRKAQELLGFKPHVSLEEGLRRQFEWEKSVYPIEQS